MNRESAAFAGAMLGHAFKKAASGQDGPSLDTKYFQTQDEDGLPTRYTPAMLERAAAAGDKLAEEYLVTIRHFQAWWRALNARRLEEAIHELGTALRNSDGHYLLGATPQIFAVMRVLAEGATSLWVTPEVAAITAYMCVIPPTYTGGFPPNPERFFQHAMEAHPQDTIKYLNKALELGMSKEQILPERASMHCNLHNYDQALADYKEYFGLPGVEHGRQYAISHFQYAFILLQHSGPPTPEKVASALSWYKQGLDAVARRPAWLDPVGHLDSLDILKAMLQQLGLVGPDGGLTETGKQVLAKQGEASASAGASGSGSGSQSQGQAAVAGAAEGAKDEAGGNACAWCKEIKPSLKACQGCVHTHKVLYCSRECQKRAWPSHKAACKAAQEAKAPA